VYLCCTATLPGLSIPLLFFFVFYSTTDQQLADLSEIYGRVVDRLLTLQLTYVLLVLVAYFYGYILLHFTSIYLSTLV